jgi:hypothetical protein
LQQQYNKRINLLIVERISAHVSHREGVYSATAMRKGFDNTPNSEQLHCMRDIAYNVFEPLREWVGGAIKINSFFR